MANLLSVLGLKPAKGGFVAAINSRSPTTSSHASEIPAPALVRWRTERDSIVSRLRVLGARANKSKHVKAAAAFIEIQSLVKNLRSDPHTLREVDELERWLRHDDVVADLDDLAVPIRVPLLAALATARAGVRA
jgi:hypothetical protein